MPTSDKALGRRPFPQLDTSPVRGFTLVELIAVLVLMGILAGVAAPALSTTEKTKHAAAARLIASDLRFARQQAVATGIRTWVLFSVATDRWTLAQEDLNTPGKSNAQVMLDAASERPMVQRLDQLFAGEELQSAQFDGGAEVGFDWLGRPLSVSEVPLATDGSVTCVSGFSITVSAHSGLVQIVTP